MLNEEVYTKIYNNNREIIKYEDCIDYLRKAKKISEKIENGLNHIETIQYEKACDDCNDAIGYQENIISALNICNKNIHEYNDNIQSELDSAITLLNSKITSLESNTRSLYTQLK